jgi:hypothetical protein
MDSNKIMDTFTFTLIVFAIAAVSLVSWLYTKSGKKMAGKAIGSVQ